MQCMYAGMMKTVQSTMHKIKPVSIVLLLQKIWILRKNVSNKYNSYEQTFDK